MNSCEIRLNDQNHCKKTCSIKLILLSMYVLMFSQPTACCNKYVLQLSTVPHSDTCEILRHYNCMFYQWHQKHKLRAASVVNLSELPHHWNTAPYAEVLNHISIDRLPLWWYVTLLKFIPAVYSTGTLNSTVNHWP